MNEFITIKQAGELTGKAEITIRRLIKGILWSGDLATEEMVRQIETAQGFTYTINRAYVLSIYKPTTQKDKLSISTGKVSRRIDTKSPIQATTQPPIQHEQVSRQNDKVSSQIQPSQELATVIDLIEVLKEQLRAKDEQIRGLIRAQERADIILKGLQDKFMMLENKPEKREQAEAEVKPEVKAETKAETKQEIKKATKPGVNKEKEETWL